MDTSSPDGSSSAARNVFRTGAVINGRYSIVDRLGTGATGSVFKALDLVHDGKVIALKTLSGADMDDPVTILRFKNEFTVAQELKHPNLIEIYGLDQTDVGQFFMTMEFVDGGTLRSRIKQRSLTFIQVISIIREVALAMQFAHDRHIVHRDLKPDNILLRSDDTVKIVDLGLARNMVSGNTLTKTGEALGTPHYMAPEQIRGIRADGRADVYSLGIIAFEMVVGKPPFIDKETYSELVHAHLTSPIPDFDKVQMMVADVPNWFEVFVNTCCEKDIEDRFQSMAHVARAIEKRMVQMGLMKGLFEEPQPIMGRMIGRLFGLR